VDRLYGFIIFFLGMIIFWQGRYLDVGNLQEPGPGFFPILVAILMMILSLFLIISRRKSEGKLFFAKPSIHVLIVFVVLLAYSCTLEYLGFIIVSFLLMTYLFKAFGGSKKWRGAVLWALASVVLAYLLFNVLLEGNLPRGILGV
jgi:putative tricarboxylic transport membrane protein